MSEPEGDLRAKLKTMVTDPARVRRDDPGNPEVCPVFDLHKVFSDEETQMKAADGCRTASIGCIECKSWVADGIVRTIAPIQGPPQRLLEKRPGVIKDVLSERQSVRAAKRAQQDAGRSAAGYGARVEMSTEELEQQIVAAETVELAGRFRSRPRFSISAGAGVRRRRSEERPAVEAATDSRPAAPFALEPQPIPAPPPEPRKVSDKDKEKAEASQSPFSVTVGLVYDGPMDLLLDLIRRQNIDIYDIPMAQITAQFLEYTHRPERDRRRRRGRVYLCGFAADSYQVEDAAAARSFGCDGSGCGRSAARVGGTAAGTRAIQGRRADADAKAASGRCDMVTAGDEGLSEG